ncbi:ACT domain-containing protein [Dialister pneumosintes]|jgi:ACT domain-containing protein|uniref:ACT domain-containing protein n=1 Tax=Dialister pneumosintes TaxID=39950 RepID=A0A1B3WDI0_9FIRM|nr:ACT domain-containing protein [Dialister pneumosintes]AOH38973.1 hypothetical protein BCB69_02685 [Dialister pneumosintes]MBS6479873.1 ACT domain-containing protein [Dialister sp.]RID94062.1 ACT domain-containing protein [Dialister pneumosintes]CDF27701.1 aCT domain protein PheB [Dialister sp. CAG:588]
MAKNTSREFYLVDFQILSEAIKKTIRTKQLLKEGTVLTINEAVKRTGISRSAYYKYKDHVAPAVDVKDEKVYSLVITVAEDIAISSRIIRKIAKGKNQIITIHRSLPVNKFTMLNVVFESLELKSSVIKLIDVIKNMKGVKKVDLIGRDKL